MFCKLSLLALVAPLVSALTLDVPQNPTSGGSITIKWNSAPNDPDSWSFELVNTVFHNSFAIANNVNPTAGQLTLTLPVVPVGDGYTLEAVNVGNIDDIFATSAGFSIGANSASVSSAPSTSGSASKSSSSSASSTPSASSTSNSVITPPASSSTPTVSNIVSPSTSASDTGTGPATTPSNFSGALASRLGSGPVGGLAVVLLSAAAGAVMIVL
ncbi:hypothetical protein GALMADRAFT_132548 [Galerina marginata CBS 339.88]|uniref:Yeast cell wall synthesis Kre9/Knh1-like N-terminal domain-containing protein n=1 Tax=Galerina marginata (strain CBS 339.88) TaxID=685588 RepID=A0A067TUA8_GALM3|nr:hypothetical protein GALMADRAFT_132548 [Galerina marginata CBS 339.88]